MDTEKMSQKRLGWVDTGRNYTLHGMGEMMQCEMMQNGYTGKEKISP